MEKVKGFLLKAYPGGLTRDEIASYLWSRGVVPTREEARLIAERVLSILPVKPKTEVWFGRECTVYVLEERQDDWGRHRDAEPIEPNGSELLKRIGEGTMAPFAQDQDEVREGVGEGRAGPDPKVQGRRPGLVGARVDPHGADSQGEPCQVQAEAVQNS